MLVRKYNMGGRAPRYNMGGGMPPQPGQMQGGPQGGGGAPPDVEGLLEMLSQIPPEVTVGEVIEKLTGGGGEPAGGGMPPSGAPMQMQ